MPKIVGRSTRVVEHDGLTIDEYVGNVASLTDQVSLAIVKIAEPTAEPWLTLDYDEWIAVIKGTVEMHSQHNGQEVQVLTVHAGETIFVAKGERFRPVFPEAGTEYIPICIPAFKPERCQREEEDGSNTEVADKLAKLHSKTNDDKASAGVQESSPSSSTSSAAKKTVYHMCQTALWEKAIAAKTAYFPPTYIQDGFFTHATAVPTRLMETANHFYTGTQGEWICLELSTETLLVNGIMTVFEEPKPVGDQMVQKHWTSSQWACPHIYGGIPSHIPGCVTNMYRMERDSDGHFLSIVGLATDTA